MTIPDGPATCWAAPARRSNPPRLRVPMRIWTDPRDGARYEVKVLAEGEQIAFWWPDGFWRTPYSQAAPAEDLTDLELVELLDRAKRLPLDDVG